MKPDLSRNTMDVIDLTEEHEKERRERIATAAMQGMVANQEWVECGEPNLIRGAIDYADELIKQLDKGE